MISNKRNVLLKTLVKPGSGLK